MAEYLIQDSTLTEIADAIRERLGSLDPISVKNMSSAICDISSGEGFTRNMQYFKCGFDLDTNEVILYGVLYDKLYQDTGSYDIDVPDTILGFNVVISSNG